MARAPAMKSCVHTPPQGESPCAKKMCLKNKAMAASMKSSSLLAVFCAIFSVCTSFHTCISTRFHTKSVCNTQASSSSRAACSSRRLQGLLMLQDSELESPTVSAEDEFADWTETGRKGRALKRKKDVPTPEYTPQQV
jgi:hypothetical protein